MRIILNDLDKYPDFISILWDNIHYNRMEDIKSFDSVELNILNGEPNDEWKWDAIEIFYTYKYNLSPESDYISGSHIIDIHNSKKKFDILSKEIISINRDIKLAELGVM